MLLSFLCFASPPLLPLTGPPSLLLRSPPSLLLTGARVRAVRADGGVRVILTGHGGGIILRVTVMSAVVRVVALALLLVSVPVKGNTLVSSGTLYLTLTSPPPLTLFQCIDSPFCTQTATYHPGSLATHTIYLPISTAV